MPDTTLHLPTDWERKTCVRRLEIRLMQSEVPDAAQLAPLYYVRMWTEWASNPEEWRPLNRHVDELSAHDWKKEDLTFIIENACGWPTDSISRPRGTQTGRLLVAAIEAGVYDVSARGDISGLVLVGWAELNPHLMPGYESMQSKGGKSTRAVTARKLAASMAEQQRNLFERQGNLMLNSQTQSPEEQKAALALVIQVDRHCGVPVRGTKAYSETVLRDAVAIIREHGQPVIEAVLTFLHENRTNPEVVTLPDTVLARFQDYILMAGRAQG